jgi:Tol biopolymer transport system component
MPADPTKLSRFWQELKRRKVIHVIIVYASAAFVIIELVNNVYETLRLPEWTPAFALIIVAIGFPLALVFSWIFDVTPQGLERTKPVEDLPVDSFEKSHPVSKRNQNLGRIINWSFLGLLVIMMGVYLITKSNVNPDASDIVKFSTILPANEYLDCYKYNSGSAVAISPDGSQIVFVAVRNGISYLMLRRLDHIEVTRMTGTEGASSPFFSRNGEWIGFFADGYLKKVPTLGGAPVTVCETRAGNDGCWIDDNRIIFADSYKRCLMLVPSKGGSPKQITTSIKFIQGKIEQQHTRPQVLPGGDKILFTVLNSLDDVKIEVVSIETGERWNLIDQACNGIYLNSGHLIYCWKGDLMAVPFDSKRLEVTGNPVLIIDGVLMDFNSRAHISVSEGGTLVYIPGDIIEPDDKLEILDISGEHRVLDLPVGRYQSPRFSPDGKRILINYLQANSSCWIYELDRGTFNRFTEKEYTAFWPIWTPDGKKVAYNSNSHGGSALNLYLKETDGNDAAERLSESDYHQQPKSWTPDGNSLIFQEGIHPETGIDILLLQMDTKEIRPLLNSSANESHPNLSRDGNWLAYVSDQSGKEDVFVCSFPDLSHTQQVSVSGGVEPLWSPECDKLYFRDITGNKLMVVSILGNNEGILNFSKPQLVMEGNFKHSSGPWGRNYDLSPDGKEWIFIMEERVDSLTNQVNIILNWQQELSELVPAAK